MDGVEKLVAELAKAFVSMSGDNETVQLVFRQCQATDRFAKLVTRQVYQDFDKALADKHSPKDETQA